MGKELSEMPEITLEDYQRVDRQLERKRARRGFTIHAIVYALVMTGLIILSVTLGDVFPWAGLPMAWWGVGLTLHYLYGVRWSTRPLAAGRHGSNSGPRPASGPPDARRAAGRHRRPWPRLTSDHGRRLPPAHAGSG
jgi:hypothetical protein